MGLNSTFLPYLAGGLTIRPTKIKFMKFGEGIGLCTLFVSHFSVSASAWAL
jgi:hypothetical protein